MQLLTEDIAKRLPPLYSQEEQGGDAIAVVKGIGLINAVIDVRRNYQTLRH